MMTALSHALRAAIARSRSPLRNGAMVFGSVAVPLVLRLALDGGSFGAQFAFIYPAALAIAILCGWRWALLSGFSGMIATAYFLMDRSMPNPMDWGELAVLVVVALALCVIVFVGSLLRDTVNELNEAKLEVDKLNSELLHRSKNALQLVQALASGAKRSVDPGAFYFALEGRLRALASANELLRFGAAKSCLLLKVVSNALRPFDDQRISVTGCDCLIERGSVVALGLALHELATNAVKYGSLSNDSGSVSVVCEPDQTKKDHVLVGWTEHGGPKVEIPTHRGMGTRLLATQRGFEILEHVYASAGVQCVIRLPIEKPSVQRPHDINTGRNKGRPAG